MRLFVFAVACIIILAMAAHPARAEDPACSDGERRMCGSDIGACVSGRSTCRDGLWSACEGGIGPKDSEICGNSLDDNCDEAIDENCFPWTSFVLIGIGMLFLGIGMIYMQKNKGERMLSEGVSKD